MNSGMFSGFGGVSAPVGQRPPLRGQSYGRAYKVGSLVADDYASSQTTSITPITAVASRGSGILEALFHVASPSNIVGVAYLQVNIDGKVAVYSTHSGAASGIFVLPVVGGYIFQSSSMYPMDGVGWEYRNSLVIRHWVSNASYDISKVVYRYRKVKK